MPSVPGRTSHPAVPVVTWSPPPAFAPLHLSLFSLQFQVSSSSLLSRCCAPVLCRRASCLLLFAFFRPSPLRFCPPRSPSFTFLRSSLSLFGCAALLHSPAHTFPPAGRASSSLVRSAHHPSLDHARGAMGTEKRRGHRQSEGDVATLFSGVEPTLLSLSPPRKRNASLACSAPPARPHESTGVLRTTFSNARIAMDRQNESGSAMPITAIAMQGLDESVLWRRNSIAAIAPDTTLALQRDGDADNNSARVWSLEQNLPKEAFLPQLLKAYNSFHDRYTRMKARKVDIEAQFEEQRRSHERFQHVADGYVRDLCNENQELRKTVDDGEKRIKWLESLLCQKGEFRACRESKEEVLQKSSSEADVAASPVRPLTPTSDKIAAEGALIQAELHFPTEHVRQQRGEEIAECCVESNAPCESVGKLEERPREIEMALDNEGPLGIVATQESGGLQMLTHDIVVPRENVLTHGDVEPSRLEGENHLASTQTSVREIFAANQVRRSLVAEPLLGNPLENARCSESSVPGDFDKAIVACSEPDIPCRSNEAGFQDLLRQHAELQDLLRQHAGLQDLHQKEAAGLLCQNAELQELHQKVVAGFLSEVEILQKVLGHFIDMTVVSDKVGRMGRDKPVLIFLHPKTGFRFRLEILKEHEVPLDVAKALELSYKNLSLGTLIGVAPWWMKEEIAFTVDQLVNFLRKFHETVTGIPYNQ